MSGNQIFALVLGATVFIPILCWAIPEMIKEYSPRKK